MATSRFTTTQYTSSHFVDSSGAILFHLPSKRICLIHLLSLNEWVLAKGRRNCGESRYDTAVREVEEETGVPCKMIAVRINTRAPPIRLPSNTPNEARAVVSATEPFMLTIREVGEEDVKLIWWFIAEVNDDGEVEEPEEGYGVGWFGYDDAVQKLTYQTDRDVVQRAIEIVREYVASPEDEDDEGDGIDKSESD